MQNVTAPRVAVLGLTLSYYAERLPSLMGTLQRQLSQFTATLAGRADIVLTVLCSQEKAVQQAVHRAELEGVDALLLIPLSYTASMMTVPTLERTRLPVIIWNTQEAQEIRADYDITALLHNHVPQGTQDLTSVLRQRGRAFGMESGHYADAGALQGLADWLCAARALTAARQLHVGLLGEPFTGMGDFLGDASLIAMQWGPQVAKLCAKDFVRLCAEAPSATLRDMEDADRRQFDVSPNVDAATFENSLRGEWALRRMVAEYGLGAFTMNFAALMEEPGCHCLPLYGVNKLMLDGLGYAGEGDFGGAALVAQLRSLCGISNFTEIYTVDYRSNRMMMTHMQECNPALARKDRKIRLVRKEFWTQGTGDYVGMHFTLEPGPVTLVGLTMEPDGRFRYVVYETRIQDIPPCPNFDIPHWVVALDEPVGEVLTRYSLAGGPHHLAATLGHQAEAIRRLAHLQSFAFAQV